MKNFRPGFLLTLCTAMGLAVLFSLGIWQAVKIGPKSEAIKAIEAGLAAGTQPLPKASQAAGGDFMRVEAALTFLDTDPLLLVNTNQSGKPGYHLYLPAKSGGSVIFVNLGWVPMDYDVLPALPRGQSRRLSGVLRQSATPGMMQIENDGSQNVWYLADIGQMAAYYKAQLSGLDLPIYPMRFFADQWATGGFASGSERQSYPAGYPKGGQLKVKLINKHREYALTWFGIAAALIAVYIGLGLQRGREQKAKKG